MLKFLIWFSTAVSVAGAFFLAFRSFQIGYSLFIVGTIIFIFVEIKQRKLYLVALNSVYLLTSLIGFYHAFKI
jgi:hypothetical protein